ncbi:hypothetical protein [Pseudodesulfovibrio sp. zrk46]|uniref:hypothetical protein n=1 Tax=Pseudodesulfovibrio sp. zrk46 TaxID=2725288 RepID=UPI001FFD238D|nr:hypothetical protein [Pseudodesulfovibrio sp. zrk46]
MVFLIDGAQLSIGSDSFKPLIETGNEFFRAISLVAHHKAIRKGSHVHGRYDNAFLFFRAKLMDNLGSYDVSLRDKVDTALKQWLLKLLHNY